MTHLGLLGLIKAVNKLSDFSVTYAWRSANHRPPILFIPRPRDQSIKTFKSNIVPLEYFYEKMDISIGRDKHIK